MSSFGIGSRHENAVYNMALHGIGSRHCHVHNAVYNMALHGIGSRHCHVHNAVYNMALHGIIDHYVYINDCSALSRTFIINVPGFSVTAPWAIIWFLDGNENKVDISIVGTNGTFFLINAHVVLRRMGAVTEIPGSNIFQL